MWGFPKALLQLSPDYCGLGITSVTDRTFIKKWATLQSALHSDGPHASAAEGLLYRAAASQGTYLIANQGVVLSAPPPKDNTHWWVNGLLEWGQSFGAHLCRKGYSPSDSGTAGPVLPLLPPTMHATCKTLQIERLADLLEIDHNHTLNWSPVFHDLHAFLPKDIPSPILFPLTTSQYWASPNDSDILQILHFTDAHIVIRRWSPAASPLMTYTCSPVTTRLKHVEVFPGTTAIRVSLIRTSSTVGTVCCRRLQPRPIISSLPPSPKLPWILWFLDHIHSLPDYHPTFFTDGSYAEGSSPEAIFRPHLLQRTAHASIVVLDSSPHWRRRPIISLRVRDIQDIGCISSYTPELLALTMAIWIRTASHLPSAIFTDSESSLDTIANRRTHLKSAKTSCHILLRRIDELLQYSG